MESSKTLTQKQKRDLEIRIVLIAKTMKEFKENKIRISKRLYNENGEIVGYTKTITSKSDMTKVFKALCDRYPRYFSNNAYFSKLFKYFR